MQIKNLIFKMLDDPKVVSDSKTTMTVPFQGQQLPISDQVGDSLKDPPPDQIMEERRLRRNLGRYLIVTVTSLCFYTFVLEHVKQLSAVFSSPSYVTTGLLIIFMTGLIFLVLSSGYPLYEFGLTLKNWKRATVEGVLFTLPVLIFLLLVKWLAIKYSPHFKGFPLFELHKGVVQDHLIGTPEGNWVWWETLFLYTFIIAPLQEIIVRGGLQGALSLYLTGRNRILVAILVTNLIFCTTHLAYPIHIVVLSFFGGLLWGWLFYRHKTIIGSTVSHVMVGLWYFWFLGIS